MKHSAPPLGYWCIPLVAAALRMLPALSLRFSEPPAGHVFLGVTYLPKDFLQYAAISRQVVADGSFLFYNPFTTEPQDPRFILLFHWAVGLVARFTGLSPIDVFEWSRVPLLFVFFATLWWFLRPVFPERGDRVATAALVGFAGGLEGFARPFANRLPEGFSLRLRQDTSQLHGWSAFASFYNPLWIASLSLALVVLRPLLFASARTPRALALSGAAFVVLFFVHPYTALGVLAVAALRPLVAWILREPLDVRRLLADGAVLGAALAATLAVSLWQLQDPVYRSSTGGVFGSENLSALWYPLTLGLLGGLALAGARRFAAARHPARAALFAWFAAVAALHWLPVLNGYKFVFLLPLPVCILAAPMARAWLEQARASGARRRGLALLGGVALFGGSLLHTVEAVRSVRSVSAFPTDAMQLVRILAREPAGNVLAPAGFGNVLPAFSSQRVWVGHWFLSKDYFVREQLFRRFTTKPAYEAALRGVLREDRIRHLVVPAERAERLAEQLGTQVAERRRVGSLELFVFDPAP